MRSRYLNKYHFILFLFAFVLFSTLLPSRAWAQAVPDTSLNKVFPDTTKTAQSINAKKTDDSLKAVQSIATLRDTIPAKPRLYSPNPKRAGMLSAILPGLGQLYNHDYWKIPIIYAGIGVSAYYFSYNLSNYNTYRKAYIDYPNDQFGGKYDQTQLQQIRDDFERYLDFTVLLASIGYVIQVLDAVAAAHLKNFDISRDLSLRMQPVAAPNGVGFGLVLNMKPKAHTMYPTGIRF